jgi:hypothetical protein
MAMRNRFRILPSVLAVLAAVSPFTLNLQGRDGVVRLNEACGQATACEVSSAHICSKADGDKLGYKCTKGCTKET